MKKICSKFLLKLFNSRLVLNVIQSAFNRLESKRISDLDELVQKERSSKFYNETKIDNYQNQKENIRIGKNTHIRGQLLIFKYDGKITIGNNCYIGEGSRLWSGDSISIGNNVLISHNVNVIDTNSHEIRHADRIERYKDLLDNGHWSKKGSIITKPIVIKDNVWLSFNTTILKGVTIGEGGIVAAGAVVTKDVPDWTIVAGNPAKVVRVIPKEER